MGEPLLTSMPEQFMKRVFYAQVCHITAFVCAWSDSARNMLKTTGKRRFAVAIGSGPRYKWKSPIGAKRSQDGKSRGRRVILVARPPWQRTCNECEARARHAWPLQCYCAPTATCTGVSQP